MRPEDDNLAKTNPELAAEWHPEKNGDLKPHDVLLIATRNSGGNAIKVMNGWLQQLLG